VKVSLRGGAAVDVRLGLVLAFILVASVLASGPATAATTAPTFARTDLPFIGNQVVEDFNGDGSLDLAGLGYLVQAIQVRLNDGAGTFGALVDYPVPWGQDLVAGEFTSDGKLDLIVTHNDPQISLSLLTGNGNGTFNAPVSFPNTSGFDSPDVAAVDLNNDAKLDLVVAHNANCFTAGCVIANTISVMLGNGDGSFQPTHEVEVGTGTGEIAVGDFNRDGIKDLAIAGSSSRFYRLLGVGDGTFNQQPTLTLTADTFGVEGTDIDVADFNGDSIQDLVVAIATNGSRTAILIGNGDGTFRQPLIITEPNLNIPQYQAVADYNGDGFQDLALSLGDGNTGLMEILNGNGDGTFQPRVMYITPPPTSVGGSTIVAANLNGDTKPDITLGRAGAFPGFLVLINSTGTAPPPTPTAPTLIGPANGATVTSPVTLDWTDVSAATSYRIQVDDSSVFSAPRVIDQTVTESRFTASTLALRRHWWRVRGINSAGTAGAWSSVRSFTPQAGATALSAISLSPASVVGSNTSQGTAMLTSAAPSGGAVVTLSSSNTSAASVPASVTVPAGATSVGFTVSTVSVTASTTAAISGTYGGATRSALLTVTPPPPPPPPIGPASLFVSPATVDGGTSAVGTIFLSVGAPAGGLVVSLTSSNTEAATVPATTTVPGGLSSSTFPVSTLVGTTTRSTIITASANGISRTATLTVIGSLAAQPALSAVSVNPTSVIGGASSQGTVTLTSAAPAGGFAVSLSSSNTAATVPASVSVAQGATSATFPIPTSAVLTSTPAAITASAGGVTRTSTLTVTPPGQSATVTVTATGRSGERVTSNPAGINVSVGSSGSASFTTGTAITLSATNGRDVVWSGACSSGGNKTRTCTFTLNANASVNANVQ
jgi:hypothetical protein